MKKKLKLKSKVDSSKFLYNEDLHKEEYDGQNTKLEPNIVDLEFNSSLSPEKKPQTLSKKKNNTKSKKLFKLRRNGNTDQDSQTDAEKVYSKVNLDDYRSQFQLSYDKLSQKYYDALDSPSKIPDIYESSTDEDRIYDDKKRIKQEDICDGNDSLLSEDIILPSQQDVEVVVYKKKKNLFNELYYTDFKPFSASENDIESNKLRKTNSVIPMTLSQVFEESSSEEIEEINLVDSFIEVSEEIVVSDDSNTNDLVLLKQNDVLHHDNGKTEDVRKLEKTDLLIITSDDSDSEPIIMQSQFNSPTKYNLEVLPSTVTDTVETKMSLNEINSMMTDEGIIFNNKDLLSIVSNNDDVKQFLLNSRYKLDEQILTHLTKQKNMSLLKYELFEIFEKGKPMLVYDNIFKTMKKMIYQTTLSQSENDEFTQIVLGLSLGRVFNFEYFTTILIKKLCEVDDIDSLKIKALSKLIQPKNLKSLYEKKLGANFEMDSKKK